MNKENELKKRKGILRNIALNSNLNFDVTVYYLIKYNNLDKIIMKIDDKPVIINTNPDKTLNSYEQFIYLIHHFVSFFNKYFPTTLYISHYIIDILIATNKKDIEKYLLSKHYIGNGKYKDFFQNSIYRIIVSNFIANAQKLECLQKLLLNENIALKNIKEYSLEEILKIIKLMSEIVFCTNNEFDRLTLFSSIDYDIKDKIRCNKLKKYNKYSENDLINKTIAFYKEHNETLIKSYLNKKQYLKYFM